MNEKLSELATRPATHVLTTRVDGRYLATLAQFWHSKGELPRSGSELIRLSLETFTELLCSNQLVDFIERHADAQEALKRMGITTKSQNKVALAQALAAEDMSFSSLNTSADPFASAKRSKKEREESGEIVDSLTLKQAQAMLDKEMDGELEGRVAEAAGRTQDFKDSLGIVPEEDN